LRHIRHFNDRAADVSLFQRRRSGDLQPKTHGGLMTENKKETVRIELTEEQKKAVREQDASAVEFTVEELEQRIAPAMTFHF
jgi:hypothetical protein